MLFYVLGSLFYLPVAATYYVHPVAGCAVSTVFYAYHIWTHRVQRAISLRGVPMDIDILEIQPWDPMEVIKQE